MITPPINNLGCDNSSVGCCEALAKCGINKCNALILIHGEDIIKLGIFSKKTTKKFKQLMSEKSEIDDCIDPIVRKTLKIKVELLNIIVNKMIGDDIKRMDSLAG